MLRPGRAMAAAVLIGWACCAASWAQQAAAPPNPVMVHYRAYLAAFNANDLATAEAEAAKALEASVARNGDGGNTAVLAINLAKVRLSRGATERAYAPALQAFNIASTGGAAGVDPLVAQLVLGRAELTEARQSSGRNRLRSAIDATAARADLRSEARDAAADLGRWFYGQQNFDAARDTWIIAGRLSNPVSVDQGMQIAEAKIAEAASRIMDTTRAQYLEQSRPTDTRLLVNGDAEYQRADRALWEAKMIVGPAARANASPEGLTVAQRAYANTLAWRNYVRAFVRSTDQSSLPEDYAQGPASGGGSPDGGCPVKMTAEPPPPFPPSAKSSGTIGAVVVRILFDEEGKVIDRRVAAAVPGIWFQPAVESVLPQWRFERAKAAGETCNLSGVWFVPIRFVFT